jgi:hypothetical protein
MYDPVEYFGCHGNTNLVNSKDIGNSVVYFQFDVTELPLDLARTYSYIHRWFHIVMLP